MTDTWLPFKGKGASIDSQTFSLEGENGGVIHVALHDVRLNRRCYEVKVGATCKAIKMPSGKPPKGHDVADRDCPGGKTFCVGLTMWCCQNHKLVGPCIGAWGC